MTVSFSLSRASLRPDSLTSFINHAIVSGGGGAVDASHQAVWSLFPGREKNDRCFAFRTQVNAGKPTFLIASAVPPEDRNNWFDVETKTVNIEDPVGRTFAFKIHDANTSASSGRHGGRKIDVVARSIAKAKASGAPFDKEQVTEEAVKWWLARRNVGFEARDVEVTASRREDHRGVLVPLSDIQGLMTVTDSSAFLNALVTGVGRGGGFGRGFLSISRA